MFLVQRIQRTFDRIHIVAHNMGIDFRNFHISMTHEFLNDTDIGSVFKHQRMAFPKNP